MTLFEQSRIALLYACQVGRMDPTTPEVWTLKVFFPLIAEQFFDVLAYERGLIVAGCFKGIDHRRRSSEQVLDTLVGCRRCLFCLLATGNVAPRTNHFRRLALLIADQLLRIVDPTVGAIFFEKAIFDRVTPVLVESSGFGFDAGQIIGMHTAAPEISVL